MAQGAVVADVVNIRGKAGSYFDGVDDKITLPNNKNLDFNGCPLTMSFWFLGGSNASDGIYAVRATGQSYGVVVKDGGVNTLTMWIKQADLNYKSSTTKGFTPGIWYHVLAIAPGKSGGNVVMYVNNVITGAGSAQTDDLISIGASDVLVGNEGVKWFNGNIRDLKFWKKALTADERTKDYNGVLVTDSLMAHYKLE